MVRHRYGGLLRTGTGLSSSCYESILIDHLLHCIYTFITLIERSLGELKFIYVL